ncbi:DUF1636 family protein [Prosthecomicrobium sp. N25]|uniref:DUF1636 family protein n=1 Tax=Prosthecomicrobium sp. N25 TaxID=3129254 RepID=UPI0030785791
MTARLVVCVSCDRYADPPAVPTRGERLARAVEARAAERGVALSVLRVDCLDGCRTPCNAALRARGRPFHAFTALGPADAEALIDAALRYAAGEPPTAALAGRTRMIPARRGS